MPNLADRLDSTLKRDPGTTLYGTTSTGEGGGGLSITTVEYTVTGNVIDLQPEPGITNFVPTNRLTGNTTLKITGFNECQGTIYVRQDATGNRFVTAQSTGRTMLREANALEDNPLLVANAWTLYTFHLFAASGTSYCRFTKVFL